MKPAKRHGRRTCDWAGDSQRIIQEAIVWFIGTTEWARSIGRGDIEAPKMRRHTWIGVHLVRRGV